MVCLKIGKYNDPGYVSCNGKIRIKDWIIDLKIPLEIFPYVFVNSLFFRWSEVFTLFRECPKSFLCQSCRPQQLAEEWSCTVRQRASKFYEFFLHLAPCVFLLTFDHQSPSHPCNVILSFQRHVKVHILHMIDPEEETLDKQTLEDRFGKIDKYCTELWSISRKFSSREKKGSRSQIDECKTWAS
jgi:hypothetical protein